MGWQWLWWVIIPVLLVALLVLVVLLLRIRALGRVVGSFECAWRAVDDQDWMSGMACYGVGRLDWYRTVSLLPRPARRWQRSQLRLGEYRQLPGAARTTMEVRCRLDGEEFYLAMDGDALAGVTGWLESLPPVNRGIT